MQERFRRKPPSQTSKKAVEWDPHQHRPEWLEKNLKSKQAHEMLETALARAYTTAASETSLLWMLLQQGWAGSDTIGGAPPLSFPARAESQDARPVGGMGAVYRPIVAELADAVHLSRPVRTIAQDDDGVTVGADGLTVRVRRAIVTIPLAIANTISYEPMLPVDRFDAASTDAGRRDHQDLHLLRRAVLARRRAVRPVGPARKPQATLTIDACTDTGKPGIMCVITEGRAARRTWDAWMRPSAKQTIMRELVDRFGQQGRLARRVSTSKIGLKSAIPVAG